MDSPLELQFREYGDASSGRPPLMLLHGLFGSSVNWHSMARRLAEPDEASGDAPWRVFAPDLRNHGRSPHSGEMDYVAMAGDLLHMLDRLGIDRVAVVGHSMGGKAAMRLALDASARVSALGVVDTAPVSYPDRFGHVVEGLLSLDRQRDRLSGRQQADVQLSGHVRSPAVRQFLLQNLQRDEDKWQWRLNLPVVIESLPKILGFPEKSTEAVFEGPALFVHGRESDYVGADAGPGIKRLFPVAEIVGIEGAGHWLYAEQPGAFLRILRRFLAPIR